jgi:hypothetical protein
LIADGLKVGETVATSGSFKLRDGLLVVPADGTGGEKKPE